MTEDEMPFEYEEDEEIRKCLIIMMVTTFFLVIGLFLAILISGVLVL